MVREIKNLRAKAKIFSRHVFTNDNGVTCTEKS
ncbi:DUF1661 domain-containing protein [Porphyromonas gingivalis]|nr:DUF1661 domain-containing protein [Porphyromonas gingivalis]